MPESQKTAHVANNVANLTFSPISFCVFVRLCSILSNEHSDYAKNKRRTNNEQKEKERSGTVQENSEFMLLLPSPHQREEHGHQHQDD